MVVSPCKPDEEYCEPTEDNAAGNCVQKSTGCKLAYLEQVVVSPDVKVSQRMMRSVHLHPDLCLQTWMSCAQLKCVVSSGFFNGLPLSGSIGLT